MILDSVGIDCQICFIFIMKNVYSNDTFASAFEMPWKWHVLFKLEYIESVSIVSEQVS